MRVTLRHRFISDLVKELLGPRNGARETFDSNDDPRNEYTLGQLVPAQAKVERTPEEEDGLAGEGGEDDGDDEAGPATLVNQAMIDSGQNFRRIPSSLGVSFVLSQMPAANEIQVCATWARYELKKDMGWERKPSYWIDTSFEGKENEERQSPDKSVQLTYKLTKLQNNTVKVSVYLSSIIVPHSERLTSSDIVFQPEIRIILKNPQMLRELGDLGFLTDDEEWRLSTRQYDHFKVYARGHLCGSYWKEIDPQRPYSISSDQPPFVWVDGKHFEAADEKIKDFINADIRTDFLPMYSAPAPVISKDIILQADKLAACENHAQLNEILSPLISKYRSWINDLKPDNSANSPDIEIIRRHNEALSRIEQGIEFLKNDYDAFYSFLFMNKAMSMQYSWNRKTGEPMKWHPFQLAFILLSLPSTADPNSKDRKICDTIWFPTGGGKTEAYLGLAAFAMAYRRRVSEADDTGSKGGEGICVISRYTLRLLTIQQFRRALKMIMACEILRCKVNEADDDVFGWQPKGMDGTGMLWGRTPFSIGLWVGSAVTPNKMLGVEYKNIQAGAVPLLERCAEDEKSDPAQVIDCPCCNTALSIPVNGIPKGKFILNLIVNKDTAITDFSSISDKNLIVENISYRHHSSKKCGYMRLELDIVQGVSPFELLKWWRDKAQDIVGVEIQSFNITRPGYFGVQSGRKGKTKDYEIHCPNHECVLNKEEYRYLVPSDEDEWDWGQVYPLYQKQNSPTVGAGIPIRAITVDDKIYGNPPSMLISTCDKFALVATLADAAAASLFGRVRTYDGKEYSQDPKATASRFSVPNFPPPSLIIQDELHLLEGPLGSSFGLFETVVGKLCDTPKYIASSATIRNSVEQVQSLMGRDSKVFPPVGIDIRNGFFLKAEEAHVLNEDTPGRLFLGVAFPGRAPQTPMLRTWGRLLQTAQDLKESGANEKDLDFFWTLVGYFNAVRELAQGETLFRQDIPQYHDKLERQNPGLVKRILPIEGFKNLSSQTGSSELPGILASMERGIEKGDALNAVAATSMFGTGVDVTRLSLMVVHGQPKSASQYIQAAGRIGRARAGLAIVLFRVSKPRDLNHYEYFTGYHRKLPVAVEPITVKPLAPKAMDKMMGALLATLVRNWRDEGIKIPDLIHSDNGGGLILQTKDEFIKAIVKCFADKWEEQHERRRPHHKVFFCDAVQAQLDRWREYARKQAEVQQPLPYTKGITKGSVVVLGDDEFSPCVFANTPKSLREVEPQVTIYTKE